MSESEDKKFSMALSMAILIEYNTLNQITSFDSISDCGGDNKIDAFYYTDDVKCLNQAL